MGFLNYETRTLCIHQKPNKILDKRNTTNYKLSRLKYHRIEYTVKRKFPIQPNINEHVCDKNIKKNNMKKKRKKPRYRLSDRK